MSSSSLIAFCVPIAAYLLGSISFAVVVSRMMGLSDPRSYGSGNPGATNVLRSGNKKAAILTLLLDALKGWLAVFVAHYLARHQFIDAPFVAYAGLAAFLGHLYPVFFRFKGGKGVATAAGVLFGFSPLLGLMCMGVWILTAVLTRYSSLSALVTAVASVPLYWLGGRMGWWPQQMMIVFVCAAMAALLLWRHQQNIQRLLTGQESKIGQKK